MKRSDLFIFNTLVLLFLSGSNFYIYLNRNDNYAYKELLSYQQIYELKNDLRITGLTNKEGDSLLIKLSGQLPNTHIKLKEGKQIYSIENLTPGIPTIKLGLNYTPSEKYQKNNRNRKSVTELFYSSIPAGNYKTYTLKEWQQSSPYIILEETKIVQHLILENIHIQKEDSSLVKIKKIAAFLLDKLDTCRGIPGDTMDVISPLQRYNLALQGKSKIWCGDFSSIFSFFMNAENIVCREVCLEGKVNEIYLAGHSLNEAYIPELHKWVLIDLTSKTILVSFNGTYLNTLELFNLSKNNVPGIKVITYKNDSLLTKDDTDVKDFYTYYFLNNPQFVYYFNTYYTKEHFKFTSRFKRYFFEDPTFAVYAGSMTANNEKFYCKQFVALSLVFFIIYLMICYFLTGIFKRRGA